MSATATATATATAAEAVARSLAAYTDGITARDLATSAQVGNSTAAKILAAMQAAGTATRTPGTSTNGRKTADIWRPATTDNTPEEPTMITTTDEAPATDDTATTDEAPATDDTATTDEAPATDDTATTDEAPATDDTATTDEAPATDDTATTDEIPATDNAETELPEAPVSAVPVSGAPVSGAPSGSADHFKIVMVAGILGDYPDGVNAAVVTDQSGLRAPVVARVLTAMEVAGAAVRKPGGTDDAPELWVRGDADLAMVNLANAAPYRECVCSCGHTHRVKTGVTVTTTRRTAARTTGEINTDGTPKFGKNGLRNQVEAFMRDLGPGHDVTPGTVGRELGGRSSGACGNAMDKLSAAGVLIMTSTAPVKYALADDAPAPVDEVAALMIRPPVSDDEADTATDDATNDATDEAAGDDASAEADSADVAHDATNGADNGTDEA